MCDGETRDPGSVLTLETVTKWQFTFCKLPVRRFGSLASDQALHRGKMEKKIGEQSEPSSFTPPSPPLISLCSLIFLSRSLVQGNGSQARMER